MTTNSTPPPEHSEPTPTIEGVEMTQLSFDTILRNWRSMGVMLYYARFGKRPGYRVKIEFKEVEE